MQLEEMRMARKMGEEDPGASGKPGGGEDENSTACWRRWTAICALIGSCGTVATPPARPAAQKTMVALLDRRRYLSNLVRDVTETLGVK